MGMISQCEYKKHRKEDRITQELFKIKTIGSLVNLGMGNIIRGSGRFLDVGIDEFYLRESARSTPKVIKAAKRKVIDLVEKAKSMEIEQWRINQQK